MCQSKKMPWHVLISRDVNSHVARQLTAAILMDIQMPIMDGLDAARTIRALPREDAASIPIFALSASVFAEDVERSLCSGMNGHLGKPVDIDQICSMLQTWLYPQQTDT
ncbi:response regulator [Bilophila wadsworthia]|uniref:response regulator n=1 Tax=Bilophila wadsworthia TaxID=35833 RepID=UPI00311A1367